MKISEQMINQIKDHLGYNDEEIKIFLENPRNEEILSKALGLANKTIVIEVIESHGCASQHKVGDKFYFDGSGNLLTKLSPKKICLYALSAVDKLVYAASELFFAGVDPNEMKFNRAACFDIGLKCGGWGKIVMEIRVEKRKKV